MKTITIACLGMTHLGLVYATAFAAKGFKLVAYDEDAEHIDALQQLKLPVSEPRLHELVQSQARNLHFTSDLEILRACDLVFIGCDVPTDEKGSSDLAGIERLVKKALPLLAPEACLILLSQVPPGFTRRINWPQEKLFYQVETLIFGQAVERALYPERYIVGTSDPQRELPNAYLALLNAFGCPILRMGYESAELAKIAINMFLVSSVTTTNILAELCENIGADWQEIAPALRLDKRIGKDAYLNPGLGIAGGNLERDLSTILTMGEAYSTEAGVVQAWLKNSQHRRNWVLDCIRKEVLNAVEKPVICILGLAYKPNTHSTKNSQALALIEELLLIADVAIHTHDPIVAKYYSQALPANQATRIQQFKNVPEALQEADALIIMTPWDCYQQLSLDFLLHHMRGKTIIDPYRLLKLNPQHLLLTAGNYFSLGQTAFRAKEQATNKDLSYV